MTFAPKKSSNKRGMPMEPMAILIAEYESNQLKMKHLMEKRPGDYSIQPLFKGLIKARDTAFDTLKTKGYDIKKLSPKVGITKAQPNDDDTNDETNNNEIIKQKKEAKAAQEKLIESMTKLQKTKPKLDQLTGKTFDSEEISIAGEKFIIRYDEKSRMRRKAIFLEKNNTQNLTTIEKSLLDKLSITEDTYEAVRTYLYDFFESLPSCQSSVAVLSNRQCEVAYYVLWSVLLKARQDVQRKIDDAKKNSISDIKIQQYEARLKSMSTRNVSPDNGPKPCDASHDEHVEIEGLIKRLEGKLDAVKSKVNSMKGGSCKLVDSMMVGMKGGALQELQRIYALYA